MANFNTLIKRKQYIWLGLILAGGAAAVGGGLYLSDLNMSSDEEAPAQGEPAPDMTGVVDSSFNSKVEQHATTEMQATAADLNKRFDSLQGEVDLLSKARTADQIRIDKLSSDNEAMQNQLKALGVKPAVSGGEPRADSSVTATRSGRGAAASQLSAANRRRGTASDGILSGGMV
ncbi:conjugal transfer pilus assembly protein TraB [Klebsiella pneumoniae]|nr:conjugal transfer pilus assembly protein TraB [Klebsiella pneumoniae]